ncbi:hypothetical protein ASC97_27420 [Rhizobium sp. Root1203]|uniref:hypothetical protein n=1 Tax=Rhizobium sp. Root1203 TaxID=1736427 RepID=UPI0007109F82|nr:hypothetical protein [Rhizobium sp. Root1203]KQV22111.1 hypothetical protein ASC97_27420 [Rhizobium sp. Root1203]
MDKQQFLQQQYLDVLASGAHVCQRWQAAFENFYVDLVDATPTYPSRRFLMYRDPDIGFDPGNVEWHFRRSPGYAPAKLNAVEKTKTTTRAKKAAAARKARREETRRKEAERQKEERRKMIAEQYHQWEEKRLRAID